MSKRTRREFLQIAGVGGVVFASGLLKACSTASGSARPTGSGGEGDFYFVQLSDTHWGYKGPANPEATVELPRAVELVNALRVAQVRLMAGEHDASLDRGAAFQEYFGQLRYSFDHKGVHFVVLDNVSDPKGILGDAQIDWLAKDLRGLPKSAPIVVFTHRPLFDLKADWDWTTADGSRAIDVLHAYPHVTVFYGHIHQEHHHQTDHIAHHAARSLVFPLPAPGSQPNRTPVQWDPAHPGRGLGVRDVDTDPRQPSYSLREIPLAKET